MNSKSVLNNDEKKILIKLRLFFITCQIYFFRKKMLICVDTVNFFLFAGNMNETVHLFNLYLKKELYDSLINYT